MPKKKGRPRTSQDKVKKVFDLYVSDRWTYAQIAEKAGVPEGSVLTIAKSDPRYPAWKEQDDARKAAEDQA